MTKQLSALTAVDLAGARRTVGAIDGCSSAEDAGRMFVDALYEACGDGLVLLRLFMTVRYDQLPEEDRRFVDARGEATQTSPLIHAGTPVFTLLSTRGRRSEWNDRRRSQHFRCIPLVSTAFVASLSMLSRQFESLGFDLGLIDDWEAAVAAKGRADDYRGMLYIRDAATDRDGQGRMIVPRQDFVAENRVRSVVGIGSGYGGHPTLATLFAFSGETFEPAAAEPVVDLLETYVGKTESLVATGRIFAV